MSLLLNHTHNQSVLSESSNQTVMKRVPPLNDNQQTRPSYDPVLKDISAIE